MKVSSLVAVCIILPVLVSCSGDQKDHDDRNSNMGGPPNQKTVKGFATPDNALDALIDAVRAKDMAAYESVIAKCDGLNTNLSYLKQRCADKSNDEARQVIFAELTGVFGLSENSISRRLPAKIAGNQASIVRAYQQGFNRELFRKFNFELRGDAWILLKVESGSVSELGANFSWQDPAGVELCREMKDFVGSFNGTEEAVKKAIEKHGVKDLDAGLFAGISISDVTVVSKSEVDEGFSYLITFKPASYAFTYRIFWRDGKITKIEDQDK